MTVRRPKLPRKLPVFDGYTVDERLCEFRKGNRETGLEFISFESPQGDELLARMARSDFRRWRRLLFRVLASTH